MSYPTGGCLLWSAVGAADGGGWRCAVAAAEEAEGGAGSRVDGAVVARVGNGDLSAALGIAAVPGLADGLSAGGGEVDGPARSCRGPVVGDGKAALEAAGPAVAQLVGGGAAGPAVVAGTAGR